MSAPTMHVNVRLFASLRESAGRDVARLEMPAGASVEDVWSRLSGDHPALASRRRSLSAAVNRKYAAFDTPLQDGDEVVFIPPVSGG